MNLRPHTFNHDGLTLRYLDTGYSDASIARPPLLCLHAHLMQAATYAALAGFLAPDYRVIALDQRGHTGTPVTPPPYTREDYLGDIEAMLTLLDMPRGGGYSRQLPGWG